MAVWNRTAAKALPLMVYWQALGEALSLIESLDLEPSRAMDILADTSGAPACSLGARLPVTERTLESFEKAADSGLGAKDCSTLPAHWLRAKRG